MYKRIHVIVNPAAGPDRPVLSILNSVFHPAGIDWDVFVTKEAGDARRYAQQSAAAGVDVVAAYGGDGTVMQAISGLVGTEIPLAIFPGGTGNAAAFELAIPGDLAEACALVCGDNSQVRQIDLGQVGENYFLLNAGVGFAAAIMEGTDRDSKDRLGLLAYLLAGLQVLRDPPMAHYHLTLDGRRIESDGITCLIANSGNLGNLGLKLAPNIDISDGLLDVVVIRKGDLGALLSVAASVIAGNENAEPLQHWQARQITLATDPAQTVQLDGEVMGSTPITTRLLPGAAHILVPKPTPPPDGA